MMDIEQIARTCHEANRALCLAHGDTSQVAWEDAPEDIKASAIDGVAHALDHPEATPEDSHLNWCAFKVADGWVYGPVKDADKKTHPCLVDYDKLPVEQWAKDYVFQAIVRSYAHVQPRRETSVAFDKTAQIEQNFTYHAPKPGQPELYTQLRDKAKELALLIAELTPASREQSVALTELETAAFWANAAIARHG